MPSRPPTPTQVHAHRFAVRRLESALVGRDPTLRRDAPRRQQRAMIAGLVVGLVALLGFAVVGLVRGDADWRGASVVRGTPSGALYAVAREPDRLVPALNLASARLLAGVVDPPAPGEPVPAVTVVRDDAMADAPRTAAAGIVGAPAVLPDPGSPAGEVWSVCDLLSFDESLPAPVAAARRSTVVLGGPTDTGRVMGPDEALVLRRGEDVFWLVRQGRRARLDANDGTLLRGLGLVVGPDPRPASAALVAALPEGPPVAPVSVPGAGGAPVEPRTAALGVPVGGIVTADGVRSFLVARDGVQEVSTVVARIAQFAFPAAAPGAAGLGRVDPDALAGVPRVAVVDVDAYPRTVPRVAGYDDGGGTVVCARTGPGGTVTTIAPDPTGPTTAVTPWPPEERGELVGGHVAGAGAYVRPTRGATAGDGGLLVDPTGRAFAVPDAPTAAALGLGDPRPVPPEVLGLLPRGPVLHTASAQLAR